MFTGISQSIETNWTCNRINKLYYYSSLHNRCLPLMYKGCKENKKFFHSLKECERKNVKDICSLPQIKGTCTGNLQRYFFDRKSKSCKPFAYGGCGGNQNKFVSKMECIRSCVRRECYLPKLKGPCKAFFPRYHYDPEQERCRFFTYGGCKGNGNNFESMGDCERACIPNETVTATTLTIFSLPSNYTTILSKMNICNLPYDIGQCTGNITKYYYTDQEDICKPFIFTGCGGNKNNFDDEENCNHLCKKK
ncbi:unnamed protein product [Gordionus sp. m RMFG-2023]